MVRRLALALPLLWIVSFAPGGATAEARPGQPVRQADVQAQADSVEELRARRAARTSRRVGSDFAA